MPLKEYFYCSFLQPTSWLLKIIIRFFLYKIIDILSGCNPKEYKNKSIVIVRLDAIGDYVLFRNFLEILTANNKYKGYKVSLIGNVAWKELALSLDKGCVENFIWVDRKRFNRNFLYRSKKIKEICSRSYDICISPVYSREFFLSDWVVKVINAKEKIGSVGNCSNIHISLKHWADKWYDKLFPASEDILFDFDRNSEFFKNLLQVDAKLLPRKTSISLSNDAINKNITIPNNSYAIIFIGGSREDKKWSVVSYSKVAMHLYQKHSLDIILCGGVEDMKLSEELVSKANCPIINKVGQTSLIDLMCLIEKAQLMVSNETGSIHLAVALNCPYVFVVYNGYHYGRFVPYPVSLDSKLHLILHPKIANDEAAYRKFSNKRGFESNLNINEIEAKDVMGKIDEALSTSEILSGVDQ